MSNKSNPTSIWPMHSAYQYPRSTASELRGFKFIEIKFKALLDDHRKEFSSLGFSIKSQSKLFLKILGIPYDEILCDYLWLSYQNNIRKPSSLALMRHKYVIGFFNAPYNENEHKQVLRRFNIWTTELSADKPEVEGISFSSLLYLFNLTVNDNKQ